MTHVFDGKPDARQGDDITPSRFRPRYRALTEEEKALHDEIKTKAAEMEALFRRAYALNPPNTGEALFDIKRDGDGVATAVGEAVEFDPFSDGAWAYYAKGIESLELAVMWTVKGLTA